MLDQKDHLLLKLLQDNSRISASEAGEELELSVPAASERIKKLLDGGYIKKFTAQLDSKKLGLDLTAFISVDSSSSSHYEDIIVQSKKKQLCAGVSLSHRRRKSFNENSCANFKQT